MVSFFRRWTLLKVFGSIPDEQSQQKVRQSGRITCTVINTSNEVKFPLLREFWMYNSSRRIMERVFVGRIVKIRNECLFFWVLWEWIVARNKQIDWEPLRRSCDLFVPCNDSIPINPEKRHSFLNWALTGKRGYNEFNSNVSLMLSITNVMYPIRVFDSVARCVFVLCLILLQPDKDLSLGTTFWIAWRWNLYVRNRCAIEIVADVFVSLQIV